MPPFPYLMIATDLDGTLLREDGTVSARSRAALAAATAAGARHVVVTGRAVPWSRHVLEDLDYQGIAVCGQGAQVYHAGERRLLTSVTLDRQTAALALAKIEADVGRVAVAASRDGVDGEVLLDRTYRVYPTLPVQYIDSRDELWAAPLNKIYLQHPELDDQELTEAATAAAGDLVGVVHAGRGIVEILPLGLTKATGLALAARRLGMTSANAIAFGDMPNDLPMLAWAGHGVAMANAHPEVRAAADEVTVSNEADGVAVVLERLLADVTP